MAPDRNDALLTTAQRAFLDDETDYGMTDSAGRATRSRMRTRLRSGLLDFEYLASDEGLAERDLAQLRETLLEERELNTTLQEMIAFIYRIRPETFQQIIQNGTDLGVRRFAPTHTVGEVSIPIHRQGAIFEQAKRKLTNDDPLTEREIRVLLTDPNTDPNTLQEHVRKHPQPDTERYTRRYR